MLQKKVHLPKYNISKHWKTKHTWITLARKLHQKRIDMMIPETIPTSTKLCCLIETNTVVFHKTKHMSASDSSYDNNTTDTDGNNNSDDDSSNDKDVLEEVLLVDIACQQHHQPTESDIRVLTHAIPPIHFFSFHSIIGILTQGHTLWIMSFHAFAMMLPISMMENCHSIRLVKSMQLNLCWRSYSMYIEMRLNRKQKTTIIQLCIATCSHQEHQQTKKSKKLLHF